MYMILPHHVDDRSCESYGARRTCPVCGASSSHLTKVHVTCFLVFSEPVCSGVIRISTLSPVLRAPKLAS